MAHPYHHALSSVLTFGGELDDYLPEHRWMDQTKSALGHLKHRSVRHSTWGIEHAIACFGPKLPNGVYRRLVLEQHIREDCGELVPTPDDWFAGAPAAPAFDTDAIMETLRHRFHILPIESALLVNWMLGQPYPQYLTLHAWGCFEAEQRFGVLYLRWPTRVLAEAVVTSIYRRIPTLGEALAPVPLAGKRFAIRGAARLSDTLPQEV